MANSNPKTASSGKVGRQACRQTISDVHEIHQMVSIGSSLGGGHLLTDAAVMSGKVAEPWSASWVFPHIPLVNGTLLDRAWIVHGLRM
mmetsp:Transcript_34243/g.57186  ORF Transcript_34243/g.57186 Transcript_34243/m.57186 type:complete len:88 (+) Transcript_34243:346-609(+)|eukprot:CAMPEP_0174334834 /NCGR_PEP_ID=MMETSP0810-20121108/20240_1 /TAXON_ID=73025 ORGANISM="Eutreptiella gymnastica-like, Strain CCMP1594" /NCGR_SAMPLE_ID=MMETSP0810 /ASSEMBLY_ACC=CAM_ASM_000659 /LENGTH=87 /DNA_ID=CAMNT_0015452731 /DNA_START=339 /DNA_END=602 /DNA_ORIENTATION=+